MLAVSIAHAGPLSPPAGSIAPTPGPEPRTAINATNTPGDANSFYRIAQSGSYYLTSNTPLIPPGFHGIEVVAADVTIDLNGFTIRSLVGAFNGVVATSSAQRLTVRNGSIYLMGGYGLYLDVDGCRVENVNCYGSGGDGFLVGPGATLINCVATSNQRGFTFAPGAVLVNCVARQNDGSGFLGGGDFGTAESYTLRDCEADTNGVSGFETYSPAVFEGCTSSGNASAGFFLGNGAGTLKNCIAVDNQGSGFVLNSNCHISGCIAKDNASTGIGASHDCVITSNQCDRNGGHGISVFRGCLVSGNLVTNSTQDGIYAQGGESRLERNHSNYNAIGYNIDGNKNVLDGNSAIDNGVSFDVDGIDNLVIRNTATGGTPNYAIVAGNAVGPRVSVTDSDGWAGIANANHPWANLGY